MSGELARFEDVRTDIVIARPPEEVLEEAMTAAKALQKVLAGKKKPVIMNNEQYLEFEDWQTVARFFGATVKVVSTEFLDYGGVKGFLARAVTLRQDGAEISAAEAMCMNDEENWSTRAKYEWQGSGESRKRVKVADDPVPLFQLRSMAQTRACAKALRNVFAWVVVLAGYRPTPAEEMTGSEESAAGGVKAPQEKKAEAATGGAEEAVTQGQGKMLFAKFKGKGVKDAEAMNFNIRLWFGIPTLELFKLPKRLFEECNKKIDAMTTTREPGDDADAV